MEGDSEGERVREIMTKIKTSSQGEDARCGDRRGEYGENRQCFNRENIGKQMVKARCFSIIKSDK